VMTAGATRMPRRSKVAVVLIAIALAVALAILLTQARAIVGDPRAAAQQGRGWRIDVPMTGGSGCDASCF